MRTIKYPPQQIYDYYQRGHKREGIAKIMGCSVACVQKALYAMGVRGAPRKHQTLSLQRIMDLRNQGYDFKSIAREVGVAYSTLWLARCRWVDSGIVFPDCHRKPRKDKGKARTTRRPAPRRRTFPIAPKIKFSKKQKMIIDDHINKGFPVWCVKSMLCNRFDEEEIWKIYGTPLPA